MATTLLYKTESLALEIHDLLKDLDPVRWKAEKKKNFKERILNLENKVIRLHSEFQDWKHGLNNKVHNSSSYIKISEKLHNFRELLAELKNHHYEGVTPKEYFNTLRKKLEISYHELSMEMESHSVRLPRLRPTNYGRTFFHMLSALLSLFFIEMLNSGLLIGIAVVFAVFCWSSEFLKRRSQKVQEKLMNFFAPVAHTHEYQKVNSATWYATALLILSLTKSPLLCAIAVIVLGFGDPAAAAIGRKMGKIKILGPKSLEGSISFILASTLTSYITLSYLHPFDSGKMLIVSAVAALFGAVGELFGKYIDDNMLVPLTSALGAFIAASLLSVSIF